MKGLFLGFLVWSSCLRHAWGIPYNITNLSSNDITVNLTEGFLSEENVPPEFSMAVETFPHTALFVPNFWLAMLKCMLTASEREFQMRASPFSETNGGFTLAMRAESPVAGQPFRLLNQHLVWAIQRICERLYHSRHYHELDATIKVYGMAVGRLTLRYDPRRAEPINEGGLTPIQGLIADDFPGENMTDFNASSPTATRQLAESTPAMNFSSVNSTSGLAEGITGVNSSSLNATGGQLQVLTLSLAHPPSPMPRLGTLLTLIRALARLAIKSFDVLADEAWQYRDPDTELLINYRKIPASEEAITWRNIAFMFASFVKAFQAAHMFYEIEGRFVKRDPDVMLETYGIILFTKFLNPELSPNVTTS